LTPFLFVFFEEVAESLDFDRLLLSLVRPAGSVPPPSTSSCVFEVDELLVCVRVLCFVTDAVSPPTPSCNSSGNPSFLDLFWFFACPCLKRRQSFTLLRKKFLCLDHFRNCRLERRWLGLGNTFVLFLLGGDSSWSGGGTTLPCKRNYLLVLLEDQEEFIALLREGRLEKSPLVSLRDESSSSSKEQSSRSETILPSQKNRSGKLLSFCLSAKIPKKELCGYTLLGTFIFVGIPCDNRMEWKRKG
jgi:hypothetical protein